MTHIKILQQVAKNNNAEYNRKFLLKLSKMTPEARHEILEYLLFVFCKHVQHLTNRTNPTFYVI